MLLIVPHTNNKKKIITYFLIFKAFLKVLVTATLFYKMFNNLLNQSIILISRQNLFCLIKVKIKWTIKQNSPIISSF